MRLGITVFKRQREESVRDTEENKMVRKGGREQQKVIPGRPRVQRISEWRNQQAHFLQS